MTLEQIEREYWADNRQTMATHRQWMYRNNVAIEEIEFDLDHPEELDIDLEMVVDWQHEGF
jgi:hypothetical protein